VLFTGAMDAALEARNRPVITLIDLCAMAERLLSDGQWRGDPLKRTPKTWDHSRLMKMVSGLILRDSLRDDRDFGSGVYRVASVGSLGTAEEVACLADPFCYVSHASAMRLHGLRPAPSTPIHFSTPENRLWRAKQAELIGRLEIEAGGPRSAFTRPHFTERLRRRKVAVHETASPADMIEMGQTRVATLGSTFVDMLAEPALCGGMASVLAVWDRHAAAYLAQITDAIDHQASKIVKVRAGYILTERLGVEAPKIQAWQTAAQRGGSRKLDPERPYAPTFSERWMLSLNLPDRSATYPI